MYHRITYVLFLIALLVSAYLPASAQTQTQLYLPQVAAPGQPTSIGTAPVLVIAHEDVIFVPDVQIEAANTGYANFYCAYGQRANHRWYVNGPGYMSAQWWLVSTTGILTTVNRTYYASGKGYIYASMWPSSSNKVTRVNWSYPAGIASNSGSSCG